MTQNMTQAYQQTPWRIQLQRFGLFLLGLIVVGLVAGLYLYITAESVSAGVTIQDLEWEKETIQRRISNLKSEIGFLSSAIEMEDRAFELGFRPNDPEQITYMVVPGYPGRQAAIMAPPPQPAPVQQVVIKPAYTESLWEWFFQGMVEMSENSKGAQP
jgi:cell division protein FtsL